jgi:6-phosphogluconate dehydrogenase
VNWPTFDVSVEQALRSCKRKEKHMEIGMIGLGRMGTNMVRRFLNAGHQCVVYDIHPEAVQALAKGEWDRGNALLTMP